jgi:indole-3-glycerol phosphate synthase
MSAAPLDVLATIVASTRRRVESARQRVPIAELDARSRDRRQAAGAFREALVGGTGWRVIAECKRRSPSRGVLRHDYDAVAIARAYTRAGAAAISVITEPSFFDGDLAHLAAVRDEVSLPLLRKDFVVDEYQVLEARAAGADAALLIVAALDDAELRRLVRFTAGCGLAALVEVHDAAEIEGALAAGASIVGVNSRNLRTLEVRLDTALELIDQIPDECVAVAESGIRTSADLERLAAAGYDAFLVGERFMSADDPGAALADLLRGPGGGPEGRAGGAV